MTEPRKTNVQNAIIAAVISVLLGGGSGLVMETKEQSDLKQQVTALSLRVEFLESNGGKQLEALKKIEDKVERGNEYLRDEVVKSLAQLQADVAVLKSRP